MTIKRRRKRSVIWLTDIEEFKRIVSESSTKKEVLSKLGYHNKGANLRALNERIQSEGISIEHMNTHEMISERIRKFTKEIPNKDLFVLGDSIRTKSVKARIIRDSIFPYECSKCGNNGNWNGEKLVLHLEHIDGNNLNNKLENLCFLCPNCHSQTSTYTGRNSKRKIDRRCIDCNINITKSYKRCSKCSSLFRGQTKVEERPTKERLVEMLKESDFKSVSEIYSITPQAVRNWCKKYELPTTKKDIDKLENI